MNDQILIEETVLDILRERQRLSDEKLLNITAERLGRSGDPLELEFYNLAIEQLVDKDKIYEIIFKVEAYEYGEHKFVDGYAFSNKPGYGYAMRKK